VLGAATGRRRLRAAPSVTAHGSGRHARRKKISGHRRGRTRRRQRGRLGAHAGCTGEIAALHRGTVAVTRAFSAALGREQTRSPARLRTVRVARALHALAILATRRPPRLVALGVGRALDARAARQITHGAARLAIGGAGTRPKTAATPQVAARALTLCVARALHAATVAQIADALRALALGAALHAGAGALLAKGPARLRAVSIARAVDAAPPAVAGRAPRLGAVRVDQA
jgi:hypothetical protein